MDFKMYCGNAWKKSLLATLPFLVAFVTTLIWGYLTTEWGRKNACALGSFLGSVGVLGIGLSPNYYCAIVAYALSGFHMTTINFLVVILCEVGDTKYASIANGLYGITWAMAEACWILIAFYV